MSTTYIDIVFEGSKFSPTKLKELTNLDIESLAEYGEMGKKGRYKGKPMPYGLGLLKISQISSENVNRSLKRIIDRLLLKKSALSKSGVDEITLDLENFSQEDIEMTIDREIIKKVSSLNASIDISSTTNFEKYYLYHSVKNKLEHRLKPKSFQAMEKHWMNEIYTTIKADNQLTKTFTDDQAERLNYLFSKKINDEKALLVGVSYSVLMSAMILYIVKYIQEEDSEKIPTFEKVLKENYS
ncbi:MAG: hypothetical protein PSX36_11860 [bacterium]|nr:hypothetical protein [bacterium]